MQAGRGMCTLEARRRRDSIGLLCSRVPPVAMALTCAWMASAAIGPVQYISPPHTDFTAASGLLRPWWAAPTLGLGLGSACVSSRTHCGASSWKLLEESIHEAPEKKHVAIEASSDAVKRRMQGQW